MVPEKTQDPLKAWTPMSWKGKVQKIKACFKSQIILSEDQKKELDQKKDNSPVEAPQASESKNPLKQAPNKGKQAPRRNEKGKAKVKWKKHYPQNYRTPKKKSTAMNNVFNMARAFMECKNKEE
ncbi:hypothetical protein O181_009936 [Austropuccinia psidii MF-1]|uniref:Uncharacterized protein n=1 Tax=Austropuccinia psidii MF-1 TaxID=1389203 RepID=A0A9Q3BQ46_9BASI|nr:hypothetical protein [Austropuccinia psidii MF-1]